MLVIIRRLWHSWEVIDTSDIFEQCFIRWKSLGQRLFDLYEHVSQRIKEQTDISQPGIVGILNISAFLFHSYTLYQPRFSVLVNHEDLLTYVWSMIPKLLA